MTQDKPVYRFWFRTASRTIVRRQFVRETNLVVIDHLGNRYRKDSPIMSNFETFKEAKRHLVGVLKHRLSVARVELATAERMTEADI